MWSTIVRMLKDIGSGIGAMIVIVLIMVGFISPMLLTLNGPIVVKIIVAINGVVFWGLLIGVWIVDAYDRRDYKK